MTEKRRPVSGLAAPVVPARGIGIARAGMPPRAAVPALPRPASLLAAAAAHWPLLLAVAALWLSTLILAALTMRASGGHLVYMRDDPYIHMAIAKNLARHGVWGLTRHEFSSSSSSVLWPLLLAGAYALFGVRDSLPLLLNLACATALCLLCYALLRREGVTPVSSAALLLAVVFLTPLPAIMFSGLEHTLQIVLAVALAWCAADALSAVGGEVRWRHALIILAPLLVAARFEGAFLVAIVCGLLVLSGRRLFGLLLGLSGLVPIAAYGAVSLAEGWYVLPNSVMLKGPTTDLFSLARLAAIFEPTSAHLATLLAAALLVAWLGWRQGGWRQGGWRRGAWKHDRIWLLNAIFLAASASHLMFARLGGGFRYEGYLLAMGMLGVGTVAAKRLGHGMLSQGRLASFSGLRDRGTAALCALCLLALIPSLGRGAISATRVWRSAANIYQQQYQMGLFLGRYYQGRTVCLNDIGAPNYLADIRCIDLWGLSSVPVAQAMLAGSYDTNKMRQVALGGGADIAAVYRHWYEDYGGLPPEWRKVGQWTISNNVVCGGDTVSFYAVKPAEAARLRACLKEFSPRLPRGVAWEVFDAQGRVLAQGR